MDGRKRPHEGSRSADEPKRSRGQRDDVSVMDPKDSRQGIVRILLPPMEFSKVIGKGGQNINKLRDMSGASIKGTEFNADERLMIVSGSPGQVLDAFDGIVDHVQQHVYNHTQRDEFTLQILVEHSKAGRVVGNKGSMIQTLKNKSGAINIRVLKDPKDYNGVMLRILCIDGNHLSIKKAHYYIQELFVDPSLLAAAAAIPTPTAGSAIGAVCAPTPVSQPTYLPTLAPVFDSNLLPQEQPPGVSLPFTSLTAFGVQAETARQLTEMKAYLSRQFGLDLSICKEGSPHFVATPVGIAGGPISMGIQPAIQPVAEAMAYRDGRGPGVGVHGQAQGRVHGALGGPHGGQVPGRYSNGGGTSGGRDREREHDFHSIDNRDGRDGRDGWRDRDRRGSRGRDGFGDASRDRDRSGDRHSAPGGGPSSTRQSVMTSNDAEEGDIVFSIPKSAVGFVIGKGGQTLKDLQNDFGVRIYVEREEVNGMRAIILKPYTNRDGSGSRGGGEAADPDALEGCRNRILAMADESLQRDASASSTAAAAAPAGNEALTSTATAATGLSRPAPLPADTDPFECVSTLQVDGVCNNLEEQS